MEDLVLTLEQCKHLQELGLDMSDSKIFHILEITPKERDGEYFEEKEWHVRPDNVYCLELQPNVVEYVPTYTLQEVWNKLPSQLVVDNVLYKLIVDGTEGWIGYIPVHPYTVEELPPLMCCSFMKNILKAYYNLLCSVIKNNGIKTNKEI